MLKDCRSSGGAAIVVGNENIAIGVYTSGCSIYSKYIKKTTKNRAIKCSNDSYC